MFNVWDSRPGYSHGMIVIAVAAFMLFAKRRRLQSEAAEPVPLMLLPLLAFCLLWVVMVLASIQVAHQLLVPAIVWCALCAACGYRVAFALLVPVGYIVTALPMWDFANPGLQAMTVGATETFLRIAGIPAYIEENIVTLPNGVFEIAGGCSGLHFFVVGLSVSVLYGNFFVPGIARFASVVLVGLAFAIVANWIRVIVVIVAGYVTDMQHFLVTVDHYYFGWLVFAICLLPFYAAARRIEHGARSAKSGTAGAVSSNGAARGFSRRLQFVTFTAIVAMVGAGVFQNVRSRAPGDQEIRIQLPTDRAGWNRISSGESVDWRPKFEGPTAEAQALYSDGEREFEIYANVYRSQGQGRELIGFDNRLEGEGRWRRTTSGTAGDGLRENVLIDRRVGKRLVIYWYEVDGERTGRELQVKLRYALRRLVAEPIAGIVAISGRCKTDCTDERRRILDFIDAAASESDTGLTIDGIVGIRDTDHLDNRLAFSAQIMCIA